MTVIILLLLDDKLKFEWQLLQTEWDSFGTKIMSITYITQCSNKCSCVTYNRKKSEK